MSLFNPFKRFRMADLPCADLSALAAALNIYEEGTKEGRIDPAQKSLKLKRCFIQYVPNLPSFIIINAAGHELYDSNPCEIFSVCPEQQAVTWEAGKHASNVTPVPQRLQPFLRRLTDQVHDIAATEALDLKRKREEEERKYYEANVEKRGKMEAEKERSGKADMIELGSKIGRRKNELDSTSRVMKWKASAAYLIVSTPNEQQTAVDKMLESAKRGPEHDLCEDCGETLRLCRNKNCTIIGCIKCFEAEFAACFSCTEFVCKQHWKKCSGCSNRFCDTYCYGKLCDCDEFMCNTCSRCGTCGDQYPKARRDLYKMKLS